MRLIAGWLPPFAIIRRRGTAHEYTQARLLGSDEGLRLVPAIARGPVRLLGVRSFVRLSTAVTGARPTSINWPGIG